MVPISSTAHGLVEVVRALAQCQVLYYISNQALLLHLSEHTRGMQIRSDVFDPKFTSAR